MGDVHENIVMQDEMAKFMGDGKPDAVLLPVIEVILIVDNDRF